MSIPKKTLGAFFPYDPKTLYLTSMCDIYFYRLDIPILEAAKSPSPKCLKLVQQALL